MKKLSIHHSTIINVNIFEESKNFPIDTDLPISTDKFWKNWFIKKLIDAGFDMNEPIERIDPFLNKEIVFIQKNKEVFIRKEEKG